MLKGQSVPDDRRPALRDIRRIGRQPPRRAQGVHRARRTPRSWRARGRLFRLPRAEDRISSEHAAPGQTPTRAFARLNDPGCYASSIARPRLFRDYIAVQLQHLIDDYGVDVSVGRSSSEIPYPYVIDDSGIEVGNVSTTELSRWFPSNELVAHRRRGRRRSPPVPALRLPPFGPVRRAAHRLQPCPAAALHRHPGRAFPAFRAVHQLRPLRRRVRRLCGWRAASEGRRVQGAVGARRAVRAG